MLKTGSSRRAALAGALALALDDAWSVADALELALRLALAAADELTALTALADASDTDLTDAELAEAMTDDGLGVYRAKLRLVLALAAAQKRSTRLSAATASDGVAGHAARHERKEVVYEDAAAAAQKQSTAARLSQETSEAAMARQFVTVCHNGEVSERTGNEEWMWTDRSQGHRSGRGGRRSWSGCRGCC